MDQFSFFVKSSEYLKAHGKFPSTEMIIPFLWHEDQSINSNGEEEGDEKTFRYLKNKDNPEEYFNLRRVQKFPEAFVYQISSDLEYMAARTAYFLATVLKGEVGDSADGPFSNPSILLDKLGDYFDPDEAMTRAETSKYWKSKGKAE